MSTLKRELKRKAIHISLGFWILFPLVASRIEAFYILAFFLALVLFVFRPSRWVSAFESMARDEDYQFRILIGPLIYILSVTICVFLYPVFISATAIGIMAFGDGFATLVGKKWGRMKNPLDRNKTVEGSVAFFVFSLIACFLAMHATSPLDSSYDILLLAAAGSLAGAIVEMFPFESHRGRSFVQRIIIDDNFFVPIVGGAVMYLLYHYCIIC